MAATPRERLNELYRRLAAAPAAKTSEEALELICRTLEAVEDELSGIPRHDPPPPRALARGGRMYRPIADSLTHLPDHGIIAKTRRHLILIGEFGSMAIVHRVRGIVEFTKQGASND